MANLQGLCDKCHSEKTGREHKGLANSQKDSRPALDTSGRVIEYGPTS
jgi:5-methylcytosine-specific restriction endonuclease McrA